MVPALAQKEIYPVADSHSYITPYTQRDHAWTDGQYNVSDEVKWSKETNATAADHLDWVVNGQGPYSRLFPGTPVALNQQEQKEKYRVETHSIIIPYVVRDQAWNYDHHDNSNFTAYKEDAPVGYKEGQEWIDPVVIPDGSTVANLTACTVAEEAEYAAEVISNAAAGVPAPNATCLTKAAAAAANNTCSVESPTCACNTTNATNATNATAATATKNATNATNATNASKVCKVNSTNATNATDATPAVAEALKLKSTPATASKISTKKVEVPKVTTPVAHKPLETKKPAAVSAVVNQTHVAQPVAVSKVSVNKTVATPIKEQVAKASSKPEFAPKAANTTVASNSTRSVHIERKSNTTAIAATNSTVKK